MAIVETYHWEFGDGTFSDEEVPVHSYSHAGTYTWTLEVTYWDSVSFDFVSGTSTGTVVITDNNKTAEQFTLRFAVSQEQGQGWSEIEGAGWLEPVANGAYTIVDDNDTPRCLVEDEDGWVWEDSTFDRTKFFQPTFIDKFYEENLRCPKFKWIASAGGTNEYFLQMYDATTKEYIMDFTEPNEVYINSSKANEGTVNSLAAGEWGWGTGAAGDGGYDYLYVRLADGTDPDTKASDYVHGYWWNEIPWEIWQKEFVAQPQKQEDSIEVIESHVFVRPQNPENKGTYDYYTSEGYRLLQQIDMEVYKDGEITTPYASVTNIPNNGEIVFSGYKVEDRRLQFVTKGSCSDIQITAINHHAIVKPKQLERSLRISDQSTAEEALCDMEYWISRSYNNPLLERVSGDTISGTVTTTTGLDGYSASGFYVDPASPLTLDNNAIAGTYTIMVYSKAATPITIAGIAFSTYGTGSGGWVLHYATGTGLAANLVIASGHVYDLRIYDSNVSTYFSIFNNDCVNKEEPKSFLPGY